jgi:hypothetical protein
MELNDLFTEEQQQKQVDAQSKWMLSSFLWVGRLKIDTKFARECHGFLKCCQRLCTLPTKTRQ